jgi:putative restriction endonuclease
MPKNRFLQHERANKAWPILIKLARNEETTTYGELANIMGIHQRVCSFFLGLIQKHCSKHDLPPLQSLVVNKDTGVPGAGYVATGRSRKEIEAAHKEVFEHPWDKIRNPF